MPARDNEDVPVVRLSGIDGCEGVLVFEHDLVLFAVHSQNTQRTFLGMRRVSSKTVALSSTFGIRRWKVDRDGGHTHTDI